MLFLIILSINLNAQIRRDGVWCFGEHALIDFNQTPPQCGTSPINSRGTCCSITDSSGNLLFSCQTGYLPYQTSAPDHRGVVFNRNGLVMDNGDSIIGTNWYYEMVIIPDPANNNTYYILHTAVNGPFGKIYYSKVDLNYNNGLGRVTEKNIFLDNMNFQYAADGLSAIKHGNGRDFWVICHLSTPGSNNNNFRKFLITPSGIQLSQQNIGPTTRDNIIRILFNSTGDKIYLYTHFGLIASYSFDRCSGILSEPIIINAEETVILPTDEIFSGAALSPNDSILYLTGDQRTFFLYQLNLNDPSPFDSRILLDVDAVHFAAGGFIKLAPDGKVYLTRGWQGSFPYNGTTIYNSYLSVIADPNQIGASCNYQPSSFYLGTGRSYWGLQNSPYFDMPAAGGTICDTLGIYNGIDRTDYENQNIIFPNPATDFVSITNLGTEFGHFSISTINGKCISTGKLTGKIDVRTLESGMYFLKLSTAENKTQTIKLIVNN